MTGWIDAIGLIEVVYAMLTTALVFAFVRLARGPSLPDRVIALDLISIITVGLIAAFSIDVDRSVFLDAALVVALISFLGTVAFAQYIERKARDD
jgi:multicomponent Na+:H+ antiporter subunit F